MLFVQHQGFWFQNRQQKKKKEKKTEMFGQKGGCNKTFFFNLCFAKCEKLSFSLTIFWQFLVDVKKTL